MKHIFITGATGFVGKHLVPALTSNKNFFVHAFVHKEETKDDLPVAKVSYGDVRDIESLDKVLLGMPVDVIIHLAAVIKSSDRADYLNVNVNGTKNLVYLAEKYKVKKIIFLSTDFVLYNVYHPYRESKLECEEIIFRSKLDFTIFRPAPIYGRGDTKNFANLIPLIKKWPVLPAIQCKMDPVFVEDVVKMIVAAIEDRRASRKIYNLPGGSFNEFQEIIKIIGNNLQLKRLVVPIPKSLFLPALRVYESLIPQPLLESYQVKKWLQNKPLDASDTKRDLGYDPLTFEEGMRLTID